MASMKSCDEVRSRVWDDRRGDREAHTNEPKIVWQTSESNFEPGSTFTGQTVYRRR